jgi:hypothetical protein
VATDAADPFGEYGETARIFEDVLLAALLQKYGRDLDWKDILVQMVNDLGKAVKVEDERFGLLDSSIDSQMDKVGAVVTVPAADSAQNSGLERRWLQA